MIRIFDYVNFSNMKNINADSGLHVQRNVINYTLRRRDDFFFYLTCPKGKEEEVLKWIERPDRVKLVPLHYTTAGSLNKMYLDVVGLRKSFPWARYPLTVIWNNEAYMAPTILQTFYATFPYSRISVANYVHWIEVPEQNKLGSIYVGNWHMWMLATSIAWTENTFFNSVYGIQMVLPYFRKFLRGDIYEDISAKMRPLYLGINVEELDKFKTNEKFEKPTFIFNQRLAQYTGASRVIRVAMRLIDDGYDFKLILTNPSQSTIKRAMEALFRKPKYRENIILNQGGLPFDKYVETLWRSDAVIAWHGGMGNKNDHPVNQWSIAFPEAIACGCYPIAHANGFFSEMLPREYLLPNREDETLYLAMRMLIESPEEYRKRASHVQSYVRENYDWNKRIDHWIKVFEDLHERSVQKAGRLTPDTVKKILNLMETRGYFKWSDIRRELSWASQIRLNRMSPYFWLCENYTETPTAEPYFYKEKGKLGEFL
ncbi:MAG: glycosyltransferase [Desulfurococcaceae archaeon]